ncbi:hypothetical protein [Lacticaseibacillus kribbianus]|uniref:hypothetical protein n=1 Tax=Lacticaseibacillus kribbianus TaxID=2926292 RepID=UPI001CD7BA69|nr:hypothetical protein [Lacticaseibacillus kribbianus]
MLLVQRAYQVQVVPARTEASAWYAARAGLSYLSPDRDGEVTITVGDANYLVRNHGTTLEVWLNGQKLETWP